MNAPIWSIDIRVQNLWDSPRKNPECYANIAFWRGAYLNPRSFLAVTPSSLRRAQRAQLKLAGIEPEETEVIELLKQASGMLFRSKRIIERQSSVPHTIEGDLEEMRLQIEDYLEKHDTGIQEDAK